MTNDSALLRSLFAKYTQGTASPQETKQLFELMADGAIDEEMKRLLRQELDETDITENYNNARWERVFNNINMETVIFGNPELTRKKRFGFAKIAGAASIIILSGIGLYFYQQKTNKRISIDQVSANDIAPGKNTATITLANGSTIVLSDAKTGVVVGAESLVYNDGSAVGTGDARHLDDRGDLLNSTDKRSLPYGRDDVRGGDNVNGQVEGSRLDDGLGGDDVRGVDGGKLGGDGNGGKDGRGQYDGRSRDHAKGVDGGGSRNNARSGLLTATTPRGGTYQITLPDGTKVWLNAASSLKFPASFAKLKDRRVELVGEGYFEVAKDKAHPFIVKTDKQEVEVLGTHFNINSYADEASTKTTLLEGSVAVRHLDDRRTDQRELNETAKNNNNHELTDQRELNETDKNNNNHELNLLNSTGKGLNSTDKRSLPYGRDDEGGRDDGKGQYDGNGRDDGKGQYEGKARQDAVTLKPGQQSVITGNNRIAVKQIDVEEAVAWKNGFFLFKATKLETVMQQVERWYNVEVVYQEPELKNITLSGSVSRYDNVSRILKTIENTDAVKIKLEGKKIIVMK